MVIAKILKIVALVGVLTLSACQSPTEIQRLDYEKTHFMSLPGWYKDETVKAFPAVQRSCEAVLNESPTKAHFTRVSGQKGLAVDWHPFCKAVKSYTAINPPSEAQWRQVLTTYLVPYRLSLNGTSKGQFTGYYEPLLHGSKKRYGSYQTPLYRLPTNPAVNINIPRSQIVRGELSNKGLELVWVDSPADAFFLQIQGSGRVMLEDGTILRLGYAGTNKHPYFPIGKTLVSRGALKVGEVSMQSICAWLKENPLQAESVMSENTSYVFFRVLEGDGPIGSHGVALTPGRSLAVDPKYISLGTPMWVDLSHPEKGEERLQHLIIAQDTGGAIKGGLRGDYFWGYGDLPTECAGKMNSDGEYYVLLPKV
jgi:membrane-bound lytic murein transglycosylase A